MMITGDRKITAAAIVMLDIGDGRTASTAPERSRRWIPPRPRSGSATVDVLAPREPQHKLRLMKADPSEQADRGHDGTTG